MFSERERPLMPAQFALRVAVLSGIALVMFSIIFFRLWYLQVLSGDKYLKQAENNQIREINVQAPRGEILDRKGNVLVDNRTALALQLQPTELPRAKRRLNEELARLGEVIGMTPPEIREQIRKQTKELPANPVTLKRDVGHDLVYYLRENQVDYPGVSVDRVYVRHYPQASFAAQIFGYVREVTEDQLKEPRYQGLLPGDQVGQSGVENTYDSVQQAGEAALNSFSTPGAFVAMNVHDGEILGLGSSPSFDPTLFTHPVIPQSTYDQLSSQTTGAPVVCELSWS